MANKRAVRNNENILPIRDLLFHCITKWHWFLISLTLCGTVAVLYILMTPPIYVRSTEILIKQESKQESKQAFQNFASTQASANAKEEIKALVSPGIMREVISRLNLGTEQIAEGTFHDINIYRSLPLRIETPDLYDNESASFTATISADYQIELKQFTLNGENLDGKYTVQPGTTVATPLGNVVIDSTAYSSKFIGRRIIVRKRNLNELINEMCGNLSAALTNEETSIIRLTVKDISTNRAKDILTTITEIYNENWLERNNQIAVKTAEFIRSRAEILKGELLELDREVALFNSDNRITSNSTSEMVQNVTNNANSEKVILLSTQLEFATFMRNQMQQSSGNDIIPANSGIDISGIEQLIGSYNSKLLERNRMAANSSDLHPHIIDLDNELGEMRTTIYTAIVDYISKLNRDIALLERQERNDITRVTTSTGYIKEQQVLLRQQKVKEALYLFLLQKLEETELSREFTASNNRVLVPPSGSNTPVEPMQRQAIMLAIVLGLVLPMTVIFIREITNRKVRGRKDIEDIDVPFIGEIPFYNPKEAIADKKHRAIIVKEGSRNVINEAFRVLRTNFEFMSDKEARNNVIIVTSFNPNSGKTFLTMNTAASLSLKGSRVLVIDGDLRHGSTSEYVNSPECGLSDYLSCSTDSIDEITVTDTGFERLNVIAIGSTPPNPTELLHCERFKQLIETVRHKYDYVFIDCPPIDIVADTQIIAEYADRTIFVVRAGLLDRAMLYELEDIYKEKRLKGLAMILNGTYTSQGRYGHRYGYSYSYGYGYGYGYGYYHKK